MCELQVAFALLPDALEGAGELGVVLGFSLHISAERDLTDHPNVAGLELERSQLGLRLQGSDDPSDRDSLPDEVRFLLQNRGRYDA